MLELIDISKKYGNNTIIENVNLTFKEGSIYIINGINGSGKSTIIKIIAGQIYKSSGSIKGNTSISYLPDKFQFPRLLGVRDYLKLITGILNIKVNIDELLNKYSIPKNRRIGALSKGNLQKLGILQIMLNQADIYLLDEPADGLDEEAKKLLKEEILNKSSSIVILILHTKSFISGSNVINVEVKEGKAIVKPKKKKDASV